MKLIGHHYCETRSVSDIAAFSARASKALHAGCKELLSLRTQSMAAADYDELAGLSRAVTVGEGKPERPKPEWCRGKCPACGDDLVCNCYRVDGGYLICWECWGSLASVPTCNYREVL